MNFLKEFWLKETRCFRQHLDAEQQADPNWQQTTMPRMGQSKLIVLWQQQAQVRARVGVVMV